MEEVKRLIELNEYRIKLYKNNKITLTCINIACIVCIICYIFNISSGEWLFIIPAILYFNAFIVLCRTLKITKVDLVKTENELIELRELYKNLKEVKENEQEIREISK